MTNMEKEKKKRYQLTAYDVMNPKQKKWADKLRKSVVQVIPHYILFNL